MVEIKVIKINSLLDALNYYNKIEETTSDFNLNFSSATFIRNNYLSIIGLALTQTQNSFTITPPKDSKVYNSMKNIGFLREFSIDKDGLDNYETMIKYTQVDLNDYESLALFYEYFSKRLKSRVKNLSKPLLNKIVQKIFELFSNVFRHSNSRYGLFCSGQFYPNRDKFYFTIVDGGVGIANSVNSYLEQKYKNIKPIFSKNSFQKLKDTEAIKWATQEGNSTTGEGGLGLALLEELIKKSDGKLEIIANKGYYGIVKKEPFFKELETSFNGTIISIGLDTNIDKYYFLAGEENGN